MNAGMDFSTWQPGRRSVRQLIKSTASGSETGDAINPLPSPPVEPSMPLSWPIRAKRQRSPSTAEKRSSTGGRSIIPKYRKKVKVVTTLPSDDFTASEDAEPEAASRAPSDGEYAPLAAKPNRPVETKKAASYWDSSDDDLSDPPESLDGAPDHTPSESRAVGASAATRSLGPRRAKLAKPHPEDLLVSGEDSPTTSLAAEKHSSSVEDNKVAGRRKSTQRRSNAIPGLTKDAKVTSRRKFTQRKSNATLDCAEPESTKVSDVAVAPSAIARTTGVMQNVEFDPDLLAMSREITKHSRIPVSDKPKPRGEPLVWADSRQALCETVPYFRILQSGCHQNDGQVFAFLFGIMGGTREYFSTDVIIARAGGSMEVDRKTGNLLQRKDQMMSDSQTVSLLNNLDNRNPVVIISADQNAAASARMPHKFNVLDWYKPVAVWAEKSQGANKVWTSIKYRFERLQTGVPPWHAPLGGKEEAAKLVCENQVRKCGKCQSEHPQIYLIGWMCLSPQCSALWKLEGGEADAPYGELEYHPGFLLDRTAWGKETAPYSLRPPLPDVGKELGDHLTYINTRGVCCPLCGRCNSRHLWEGWKCEGDCDFELMPERKAVTPVMLHMPWEAMGNGPGLARSTYGVVVCSLTSATLTSTRSIPIPFQVLRGGSCMRLRMLSSMKSLAVQMTCSQTCRQVT